MTTDKQIQANIQNSALGGVKSAQGKNITKYNAVKHGIFTITISAYEADHYQEVLAELIDQYQPIGFLETTLVERIAVSYLRLFRVAKAEHEFMKSKLDPMRIIKNKPLPNDFEKLAAEIEEAEVQGYKPLIDSEAIRELEQVLTRYDTTIENKLYKAIHELQRLQAIRLGHQVTLPMALDVSIDKNYED